MQSEITWNGGPGCVSSAEQPVSGTDSPKLSSVMSCAAVLHRGDTQVGVVGGGEGGEVGCVLVESSLAHRHADVDDDGGYVR